eukprot:GFYU01000402.1.p1 GENE.GFYU01000402.1~~GFYU01000402.1.p1  ORF type:complete len:251 (+),score=71.52 GFYU01000402.1:210-962(+)
MSKCIHFLGLQPKKKTDPDIVTGLENVSVKDVDVTKGTAAANGNGEKVVAASTVAKPKYAHKCGYGYATADSRRAWLTAKGITGAAADKISNSLEASTDPSHPIYYWQLFSVLGASRIEKIVQRFYENVYADDEDPEFKRAFTRISGIGHHVRTQTQFWIDAFGGGRAYHGGWYRLSFHHEYNARDIMHRKGAERWMMHMNKAIEESDLTDDPRVRECFLEFLKVHMDKYADQFDFVADGIQYGPNTKSK